MKKLLVFTLSFILVISCSLTGFASNFDGDEIQYDKIISKLEKENVSKKQIDNLILKLKNGEQWDNTKEEFKNLKPQISTDTYKKTIYPDGSYVILKIEPLPQNRAIYSKSGYLVTGDWLLADASYKVDYERDPNANRARITDQYSFRITTFAGSYSDEERGFLNGWKKETNAWYAFKYTASQDAVSNRYYVKVFVGANGPRVEQSRVR